MKTLEEYRAEVMAKLLPEAPRRPKAEDVLAEARAKCTKNVIRFNAAVAAHSRLVHQQHSMARVQYGDIYCPLDDSGSMCESSDGDSDADAPSSKCGIQSIPIHRSAHEVEPMAASEDDAAADAIPASAVDPSRVGWRTASTLLGASRRRKSAPDASEYSYAAAAAAAAAANIAAMRHSEAPTCTDRPGDIGCEDWVHRAACLTTSSEITPRGKGRLAKSRLLHLIHNNAGPAAVVAAASGAVPATLGAGHTSDDETDGEAETCPLRSPRSVSRARSRVMGSGGGAAALSPRPPAAPRSPANRRSSATASSLAFFSGPQAFASDACIDQGISGSWSMSKNGSTSGGAGASGAADGEDVVGEWSVCGSPTTAPRSRCPTGSSLGPNGAGRPLSRCATSAFAMARSAAVSLRSLRVVVPVSPDGTPAAAAASPASPHSPSGPGKATTASPSPVCAARQMRRSASCNAPLPGAVPVVWECDCTAPRVRPPPQQHELVKGDCLEGPPAGNTAASYVNAGPAGFADAAGGGSLGHTPSRRGFTGQGSRSMNVSSRGEEMTPGAKPATGRPMTAVRGQVPPARGFSRRSIDEGRLASLKRLPTGAATSFSAPQAELLPAMPTSQQQPDKPVPSGGLHSPSLSRRQSRVTLVGQALEASPLAVPVDRARPGQGQGRAVPPLVDATAGPGTCVGVGGGSGALRPPGTASSPGAPPRNRSTKFPSLDAASPVVTAGDCSGGGCRREKEEPGIMARLFRELRELRMRAEGADADG